MGQRSRTGFLPFAAPTARMASGLPNLSRDLLRRFVFLRTGSSARHSRRGVETPFQRDPASRRMSAAARINIPRSGVRSRRAPGDGSFSLSMLTRTRLGRSFSHSTRRARGRSQSASASRRESSTHLKTYRSLLVHGSGLLYQRLNIAIERHRLPAIFGHEIKWYHVRKWREHRSQRVWCGHGPGNDADFTTP